MRAPKRNQMKGQKYQNSDLLYKFTFFYFDEDIEYDKNFSQLQNKSKIMAVDE